MTESAGNSSRSRGRFAAACGRRGRRASRIGRWCARRLADGVSTLRGALDSEDTRVMIDGARASWESTSSRDDAGRDAGGPRRGRPDSGARSRSVLCQQRHDDSLSHGARDARARRVSARRRRADARAADRRFARRAAINWARTPRAKTTTAARRSSFTPTACPAARRRFAATSRASSSAAC